MCSKDITFRNYSKFDAKQYVHDLDIALRESNIDWVDDDVDRTWSEFRNIFLQIGDRHAPVVTRRLRNRSNWWITNDIIVCTNVIMS